MTYILVRNEIVLPLTSTDEASIAVVTSAARSVKLSTGRSIALNSTPVSALVIVKYTATLTDLKYINQLWAQSVKFTNLVSLAAIPSIKNSQVHTPFW